MDVDFCWDTSETGCICGHDCAPPQWMQDMWAAERERERCKAITWTNDPERLIVRCKLPEHPTGSHLDDPKEGVK